MDDLQDEAKRGEQAETRRAALVQKKADLEKRIRELGSLPADAYEKYRDHPPANLHRLLEKSQAQLKKYGCVKFFRKAGCVNISG